MQTRKGKSGDGEIWRVVMNVGHLGSDHRKPAFQPVEPGKDRHRLQHQNRQIKHHAHGHLPQQGVAIPVDHGMPESVRTPDVEQEREHRHGVADQADERGRAGDGFITLEANKVHGGAQREGARAQGDGGEIDGDP